MVVLQSLRQAPGILRENPVILVPFALLAVLQTPQLFFDSLDPIVSALVSVLFAGVLLFVTPAIYAGAIGMTNEAAGDERTSIGRFRRDARENYVSVLIAYLFITGVTLGVVIAVVLAAVVGAVAFGVAGGGTPLLVVGVGALALVGLAFLIALFAVHFYAHAIVIEGEGAVSGLVRSVSVVRGNLRPVAGYALVSLVFGGALGGGYTLVIAAVFPSAPAPGEPAPLPDLVPAVLGSSGVVIGTTVFGAFFLAFSVVFYRELVDAGSREAAVTGGPVDDFGAGAAEVGR